MSASQREAVRQYIQQQAEHHRTRTFREEYLELLRRSGVEFDERYLSSNAPAGAGGFLLPTTGGLHHRLSSATMSARDHICRSISESASVEVSRNFAVSYRCNISTIQRFNAATAIALKSYRHLDSVLVKSLHPHQELRVLSI